MGKEKKETRTNGMEKKITVLEHASKALTLKTFSLLQVEREIIKPDLLCAPKVIFFAISHRCCFCFNSFSVIFSVLIRRQRHNKYTHEVLFCPLLIGDGADVLVSFCYSNDDVDGSEASVFQRPRT